MGDIVERLRAITGQAGDYGDVQLRNEAAAEIERLRAEIKLLQGYRDNAEAEASIASLAAQRLRLSEAERDAVECAISMIMDAEYYGGDEPPRAATLRGLLERHA